MMGEIWSAVEPLPVPLVGGMVPAQIGGAMSKAIVAGGYGPGDMVKVDCEEGEDGAITFERIAAPEEEEAEEPNGETPRALPPPAR